MKTNLWHILSLATLMTSRVGADQPGPQDVVRDFANRFNNRWVDELVGPVDFEFVYFGQSNEAYPLAEVKAFQQAKRVEELPDGRTIFRPAAGAPDSVNAQPVVFDANGVQETTPLAGDSRQTNPATSRSGMAAPDTLVPPGGEIAPAVGRGTGAPQRGLSASVYTRPFVPDPRKAVGPRPPKVRYWGDRRGDPNSYDLSEVDVPALLSRPMPAYAARMGGMQLGVALPQPTEQELPAVTQIEKEYSLAQRRVMRLDLQEIYSRIPSGAFLEIEVTGVESKGPEATAQVTWAFTDQSENKTTSSLVLRETAEGWRVERAWEFIQQVISSR